MARARVDAVFDTSILIDYLMGRGDAREELDRYSRRAISIVTWMELRTGARNEDEADVIDLFLREFQVIEISREVARRAIEIRKRTGLRLPDAIIWATAHLESTQLVTRNTRDFPKGDPHIRVPY